MKQIAFFSGTVTYSKVGNDETVATVRGKIQHPVLGRESVVYTSIVVKKNDDGGFETLNTIYKPFPTQE